MSALRALPSVEQLAAELARRELDREGGTQTQIRPDAVVIAVARGEIERRRRELLSGEAPAGAVDLLASAHAALMDARRSSLREVINATGVIVHTNLGRAPLAAQAADAVARVASGYSSLELDLGTGQRGSRQTHVADALCALTGAEAALAVNNAAAAVLLAAATLAGRGRSVVVSRGQLIEIGGSFRIPDVIAASGSRLVEVGTTNRTGLEDYRRAIADEHAHGRSVGAILRAHPSNFRTLGFVAEVDIEPLCTLGVPVIDDVGSGVLGERFGPVGGLGRLDEEPSLRRSVKAGAALVCCSGDKLLGGPQAGLLVGHAEAVQWAAGHPLARALRIDKLSLAALAATLALHADPARARREIPVLAMLDATPEVLRVRAERLVAALGEGGLRASVITSAARVGGGALPLLELEGPVVRLEPGAAGADGDAAALRTADLPVLCRIHDGALLLDPRTMSDAQADSAARVCVGVLAPGRGGGPGQP